MQHFDINSTDRDAKIAPIQLADGTFAPRLTPEAELRAPGFWTNLKDFLTERSVKLPRNARADVFQTAGLDKSFSESVKAFFSPAPRPGPATSGASPSGMTIDLEPGYRVFWRNLRDMVSPPKLPPLKLTSKPVPVRPLWGKRKEFSLAQSIAIGVHALIAVLILVPIGRKVIQSQLGVQQVVLVDPNDISPYLAEAAGRQRQSGRRRWRRRTHAAPRPRAANCPAGA